MEDNKITIISAALEDVHELVPNLRQDDINELKALGITPEQSLLRGLIYSDECYAVRFQNKTIGLFGVSDYNMPKGFGSIWFLGSDECTNHPITFVKQGIKYVNKWLQKYDVLLNAVDIRNTSHIEWIKRIGLSISNSVIVNGYQFLQFYKVKGVK